MPKRAKDTRGGRGYSSAWARTRGRYLKHHSTCEHTACTAPATDVHHLDGLGPTGPLGHKWINLQALCHSHHSKITAREQPGGWAAAPPRTRPAAPHPGLIARPPLGRDLEKSRGGTDGVSGSHPVRVSKSAPRASDTPKVPMKPGQNAPYAPLIWGAFDRTEATFGPCGAYRTTEGAS